MNEPEKQHWVPKSYSRYFRDPSTSVKKAFVWFFEREGALKKPRFVPVDSIFFERHLYTIELDGGGKHFGAEKAYAENIDSKYPPLIAKIEARKPLTDEEHESLCLFIAAQMLRTPHFRDSVFRFMAQIADAQESMAAANGTTSTEAEFIRQKAKNIHTLNTMELIPEIASIMKGMNVAFCCAPTTGKRFITSDNPVFMRSPSLQFQRLLSPGLGLKDVEVYFPASPTTLVVLTWQNYRGYIRLDNGWISEMNRWIRNHAVKWFISPSKTTELYWFSRYPADPFFILKVLRYRMGSLFQQLNYWYAKRKTRL